MKKPVLTCEEMKKYEQAAIAAGYPSLLLMEHAAAAVADALERRLQGVKGKRVLFVCSKGNNGGDGLAVARIWADRGGLSEIWLTQPPRTPDADTNLRLCSLRCLPVTDLSQADEMPFEEGITGFDAIVDALYGTGFHGTPDALSRLLITAINEREPGVPVIAVDIPSGIEGDTGLAAADHVRADVTVTFHAAKRGLYLTAARADIGQIVIAPIGLDDLDDDITGGLLASALLRMDTEELRYLPERALTAHKGDHGRVLIYAGSMGMAGAAAMCARACVTAGAGLVTIACEKELIPVLQVLVPCAMCIPVEKAVAERPAYDVFVCGCGLGQNDEKWQNILALWDEERPSVWDADALNMLSAHPMHLGELAVITPHIGEAARLLRQSNAEVSADRVKAVKALHRKFGCTVVLKSDIPLICDGREITLIANGTPALAKGGSGDVLCGVIASLYAQGCDEPAAMGALWHAAAAAAGEKRCGRREMTAEDLIGSLHEAEAAANEENA